MRIAVVGDVHGRFDDEDVRWLDGAGYAAICFVGDLGGYRSETALDTARTIGRLETPAFVVPGNHDGASLVQLGAEALGQRFLADRLGAGMEDRVASLREALGPVRWCAFERIDLQAVQLVVGRPHSFGGPTLAFGGYLHRAYGVATLADSASRLRGLMDATDARPVVVLAHNGPAGLGDRRDSPFGRDFHPDEGDWGDPDLRDALDHARANGRRVVAVLAGHMHHTVRGGGRRPACTVDQDTLVLNAARVPRIEARGGRHHLRLTVGREAVEAHAVSVHGEHVVEDHLGTVSLA